MPIRINLLAEAHELEEQRRRDPVKRAIYIACGVAGLFLVWAASKQVLIFAQQKRLSDLETEIKQSSKEFDAVSSNQQQLAEIHLKLESLHTLATNRLLQGSVLNALQKVAAEDIQVTRFRVSQQYMATPAEKSRVSEATGRTIPGKPATAVEQMSFTLEGRDMSARPGEEEFNKWRRNLGEVAFFADLLNKTNEFRLNFRSAPLVTPVSPNPYVTFTLEARLPDRVR